jgi:hypothetical protein
LSAHGLVHCPAEHENFPYGKLYSALHTVPSGNSLEEKVTIYL